MNKPIQLIFNYHKFRQVVSNVSKHQRNYDQLLKHNKNNKKKLFQLQDNHHKIRQNIAFNYDYLKKEFNTDYFDSFLDLHMEYEKQYNTINEEIYSILDDIHKTERKLIHEKCELSKNTTMMDAMIKRI
jgi:hypothetical protein